MKMKTLEDLFHHELKDLVSAEKQLTKALPKMAKAASSEDLRQAFETHLGETEQQLARLEEICEKLDVPTRGAKCQAMEGLIEEGKEFLESDLEGKNATLATPAIFVGLVQWCDKVLTE